MSARVMLYNDLCLLFAAYADRRAVPLTDLNGGADSPWSADLRFRLAGAQYRIRNLVDGDEQALVEFGGMLGDRSRDMFCPYPWSDADACRLSFKRAVANSRNRVDASYLLFREAVPISHFFLWKAGAGSVSQMVGLSIPELGIAVADSYAGQGFGGLLVRMLIASAANAGADAVELTTAVDNEAGWRAYERAGFVSTGLIRIPLEVDVTAVEAGEVIGERFRTERQMVYIIANDKRSAVLDFLAAKRERADEA